MKKLLYSVILIVLIILSSCSNNTQNSDIENNTTVGISDTNPNSNTDQDEETIEMIYVLINGNKLEIELVNNSSVDALVELLKNGNITYQADDYGNFEKVGNIGYTLPQNNTSINTKPGDVILYQGKSICLYYGNNSWSFTRIGKINGYSQSELMNLLGAGKGEIEVTLSLE